MHGAPSSFARDRDRAGVEAFVLAEGYDGLGFSRNPPETGDFSTNRAAGERPRKPPEGRSWKVNFPILEKFMEGVPHFFRISSVLFF